MKTLIVYVHPDHESHAKYTLDKVEEALKTKNSEYEVLDLYKINFNPVLSYDEMYESKTKGIATDVEQIQKKVTESDKLIFIYPIWWNGMPAILKGFMDRVMTPGFAYKYVNKIPFGLLKGKKASLFVSTGANKVLSCIFLGNRFKKVAAKDNLGFCGINTSVYHVDSAFELNDKQKKKIAKNVKKALG